SAALIAEEINVKRVETRGDESEFADVSVKPNFKTLGKRCGPKLKDITAALKAFGHEQVARLEAGETVVVEGETLALEDVLLQRTTKGEAAVATDGHVTVALDTHLDDALRREGIARDVTSLLQTARRDAGLEVSDRVDVTWTCADDTVAAALREHADAIS